jgi:hypothetical protein
MSTHRYLPIAAAAIVLSSFSANSETITGSGQYGVGSSRNFLNLAVTAKELDASNCTGVMTPNVSRSPRQTAATREAPAAVWRRAGGFVGVVDAIQINESISQSAVRLVERAQSLRHGKSSIGVGFNGKCLLKGRYYSIIGLTEKLQRLGGLPSQSRILLLIGGIIAIAL